MKRRWFLVGIIIGQLLMTPMIIYLQKNIKWLKEHPATNVMVIPSSVFLHKYHRDYVIRNIPNANNSNKNLRVIITHQHIVQKEHDKRFGKSKNITLGFYDNTFHEIWTVDSTDVLTHEMRHVFEGWFHQ